MSSISISIWAMAGCAAVLPLLFSAPAFAEEPPVKYFAEGIERYRRGDYAEALRSLGAAYEAQPSVADYALLYMAKSHLQIGDVENAVQSARKLYSAYPDSPLVEEARGIEVMAALQGKNDGAIALLENYVRDYPSDMEMKLLLAGILKESGRAEEAKPLFRDVYRAACPLSDDALAELGPEDVTAEDLVERGGNLLSSGQYGTAERELRAALKDCDDSLRPHAAEKLALSLFKQRKYSEASGLFVEVGDLYNAARSFVRAGMQEEFEAAMKKLAASGDPTGAKLMVAYSGDLRRGGKTKEALKLLGKVIDNYPDMAEDALWNKGWIQYMGGEFGKARKTFAGLHSEYGSSKYLYWQARATERAGEDASSLYGKIKDSGFYGTLAKLKTGKIAEPDAAAETQSDDTPPRMERVDLLAEAGLRQEAARELLLKAERNGDSRGLRDIALKLTALEEYREAILVASTLPEEMRPFEVQYPLAFWPRVSSSASEHGMDPYLLLSLIREESRFDPEALSPVGAVGLMQLMPQTATQTARKLKVVVKVPDSLRDADTNIRLGSDYLSGLLKEFDSVPAALAAYNAGGQRVRTWLTQNNYGSTDEFIEDIPFEETRNYVKRIVSTYFRYWRARPGEGLGPKML